MSGEKCGAGFYDSDIWETSPESRQQHRRRSDQAEAGPESSFNDLAQSNVDYKEMNRRSV